MLGKMTSIPAPTYQFIDMSRTHYNEIKLLSKAFCIGRAPLKNSSRKTDEKNNIYIRSPVVSATHIEFYKNVHRFMTVANKSKNGFFLIDEHSTNVEFLEGEDKSTVKSGCIIGLCFSKKYLQDYKDENIPEANLISETLKQCKVLVQLFTDYRTTVAGKIYSAEDHLEGIESQLYDLVYQIGTASFKRSGMLPSRIEEVVNDTKREYPPFEIDPREISFQKKMFDAEIENSYDDFFDHYSDSDNDSDAGTNSYPEDESDLDIAELDFENGDESLDEDSAESEDLEAESEGLEVTTELSLKDEKSRESPQSLSSSDKQALSGNSLFSSLKRSYDESNCASAQALDFDEETERATKRRLCELTELCSSKSEEIEKLNEEIRNLKKSKSRTKAAILGAASGAAITLTALYQIGSRMNL